MAARGNDHGAEARAGVQSVDRALGILQLFRSGPVELGITEIARAANLNLSTAHRLVRALCAEHFMEQDPTTDRYRLGPSLFVLGQRALENSGYAVALPVLQQLTEVTGESATLGVRRGNEIVVVLTTASSSGCGSITSSEPGSACTRRQWARRSSRTPAPRPRMSWANWVRSSGTRHRPSSIRRSWNPTCARPVIAGYAVNREERYDGVSAIGAPVLDSGGAAQAAVGLQGPSIRIDAAGVDALGVVVRRAADEIAELVHSGASTG